ncbi:MAG: AAA family ATPase [Lachnospiraceae bacterium]|nr:AAA family ATPase [Lachnospiraceae bacterium]
MRLIKLHIDNFGILSNYDLSFDEGLNIFVSENGTGKSTLAAFIKVMLYGFEGDGTRAIYRERDVYRPWQGGVYGGNITFETEGKEYVAYKTFGETAGGDIFKLYDNETGLLSGDYSKDLGEEIFLLDDQSFKKSVFISQNDCEGELTDRIKARISNLSDVSGDVDKSKAGIKKLDDFLTKNSFDIKKKTGHNLNIKLNELNTELVRYRYLDETYINKQSELEDYQNRQKQILEETNKSNIIFGQMDSLRLSDEEALRLDKLREKQVDKLSMSEIDALIEASSEKAKKRRTTRALLEVLGVVALLAAVVLIVAEIMPVGICLAVLGAALIIGGLVFGGAKSEDSSLVSLKTLRLEYDQLEEKYLQYEAARDKYDRSIKNRGDLSYDDCTGRIGSLNRELDDISEKMKRRDELLIEVDKTTEQIEELREKIRLVRLTRDMLSDANESFTNRYKDDVYKYFLSFVSMMGHTATLSMNSQMQVLKQEGGLLREVDTQSMGIKDLYGIALRLSFAEAMFTDEKSFLIMDDPFVNFDDVRYEAAAAFLKKLAEKYQIIYFTCSKNRAV